MGCYWNSSDVNDALDLWYNLFNDVVDKHLPKKSKRVRAASNPWLNNDIKIICQQEITYIVKLCVVTMVVIGMNLNCI